MQYSLCWYKLQNKRWRIYKSAFLYITTLAPRQPDSVAEIGKNKFEEGLICVSDFLNVSKETNHLKRIEAQCLANTAKPFIIDNSNPLFLIKSGLVRLPSICNKSIVLGLAISKHKMLCICFDNDKQISDNNIEDYIEIMRNHLHIFSAGSRSQNILDLVIPYEYKSCMSDKNLIDYINHFRNQTDLVFNFYCNNIDSHKAINILCNYSYMVLYNNLRNTLSKNSIIMSRRR